MSDDAVTGYTACAPTANGHSKQLASRKNFLMVGSVKGYRSALPCVISYCMAYMSLPDPVALAFLTKDAVTL